MEEYWHVVVVFGLCVFLVVYSYAIYPLCLMALSRFSLLKRNTRYVRNGMDRWPSEIEPPSVAVIISAFNEEGCIRERIENLLSLNYPSRKIAFYIGTDGCSDNTEAIIREFDDDRVKPSFFEKNRGKASVLNDLVELANEDILVFSDANTFFECSAVECLVRHFSDPTIGGVCGELNLVSSESGGNLDGVYWKYERLLKFHESRIGGLLGANGAIYAIRKALYIEIPSDTIVDDFSIALNVSLAGKTVIYDADARAIEEVAPTHADEFGRRVRIGSGNFQSLFRYLGLLNPFKGVLWWTYVSHKVLRWVTPFFLLIAFLCTAFLSLHSVVFGVLTLLQVVVYLLAFCLRNKSPENKLLGLLVFWVMMNAALAKGAFKLASGRASGTWQSTKR